MGSDGFVFLLSTGTRMLLILKSINSSYDKSISLSANWRFGLLISARPNYAYQTDKCRPKTQPFGLASSIAILGWVLQRLHLCSISFWAFQDWVSHPRKSFTWASYFLLSLLKKLNKDYKYWINILFKLRANTLITYLNEDFRIFNQFLFNYNWILTRKNSIRISIFD